MGNDFQYHIEELGWEDPRKKTRSLVKGIMSMRARESMPGWKRVDRDMGFGQLTLGVFAAGRALSRGEILVVEGVSATRLWPQRHGQAGLGLTWYFCSWTSL